MSQSSRREKVRCACIGHDAQCVSAAMDCVVKQDPQSSEINNEIIAFFRETWDVFAPR
jgi:hypothetical protein